MIIKPSVTYQDFQEYRKRTEDDSGSDNDEKDNHKSEIHRSLVIWHLFPSLEVNLQNQKVEWSTCLSYRLPS